MIQMVPEIKFMTHGNHKWQDYPQNPRNKYANESDNISQTKDKVCFQYIKVDEKDNKDESVMQYTSN